MPLGIDGAMLLCTIFDESFSGSKSNPRLCCTVPLVLGGDSDVVIFPYIQCISGSVLCILYTVPNLIAMDMP